MDDSFDVSAAEESFIEQKNIHTCDVCNYVTNNKSNFNRHKKTHSKDVNNNSSDKQYCDQCGKSYKSKFGLRLHIKNKHEKVFKYTCTICDRGFNQAVQYRSHCAGHHKVSINNCKNCKQGFSSPGTLQRHLQTCIASYTDADKKPKNYKCDICGENYTRKYSLVYHIKGKHSQPRYNCKVCNRYFAWRSSLSAHKQASPDCS